jgi:glutathione S-transferase
MQADLFSMLIAIHKCEDADKKKALCEKFCTVAIPRAVAMLEARMKVNGYKFVAGNRFTIGDAAWGSFFITCCNMPMPFMPDVKAMVAKYPCLCEYQKRCEAVIPKIDAARIKCPM